MCEGKITGEIDIAEASQENIMNLATRGNWLGGKTDMTNQAATAKKKSTLDRLGGQKFIVILVIIALFLFFFAMSSNFRKYTTIVSILDYSYYIALMAIGVTFPLITGRC